jgi:two-component system, sensor histidine kinase
MCYFQAEMNPSPSSDQAVLVRAAQIKATYGAVPSIWVATAIGALILAAAMSGEIPARTLVAWLAAVYAAVGYALYLRHRYARAAPSPERAGPWGTRLAIAFFLIGCVWGGAGVVMFRPDFSAHQLVLTLALFLAAIATIASGIALVPTMWALTVPITAPILVRTAIEGDFLHGMIAAGGLVLLALILYYGSYVNRLIVESFSLRFENVLARARAEEASRAKSRFLASASHDLRQPLHTLSLYSAALKLRAVDGDTGEIAGHINEALAALSVLVDSLLDISKLEAGAVQPEPQRVSVRALIERIDADYRPVANRKGLEFRVVAGDHWAQSDPVLLERLVRNLVDNAFKYTAAGSVTLAAESDEDKVRITVRDTGPGIPVSERERIFEEFYQIGNPERDRSQGLGLGLAIVRRLADLLGLEVELETALGRGSTFAVTMPRALEGAAVPRASGAAVAAGSGGLAGARVLVIDDEPGVRSGMRALLEQLGCRVAVCGGYAEAERLLDEKALEVDLIVADFRLRRHENGIDTVRRLRERLGDVPALLVSGDTAPERLHEARASGLPLLHKPVSAEKLTEAMLAALQR